MQPGLVEIVGHHLRARRERGLDPGLHAQAALQRLLGQQSRRHHHERIRGIGAGGDGGDHHVAVAEVEILALDRHPLTRFGGLAVFLVERLGERGRRLGERHAVLRPLRPGDRRLDVSKIEMEHPGERRVGRLGGAVQALRLGIGLDQGDALLLARGRLKIGERLLVDREEAAGRAIFRRHVGDGGAVLERQIGEADAEELHELADHAGPPAASR